MIAHPVLQAYGTFASHKLGALAPKRDVRTLQFAKYLDDAVALPTVPPNYDFTKAVTSWPMYGNDHLGDCTCAAAGHMVQAWSAAVGSPKTLADADVEAAYWALGAQDTGRYEIDVLNYWRNTGIGGDRIAAYVQLDPKNAAHMRAAIYLFGGVYVGIALPVSAQTQVVWRVASGANSAPGSWGGHAVPFHAYSQSTFTCVTWGHTLRLTVAFNARYTDEAYAILSPDFFVAGRSPAGFDAATLQADLAAL